MTTNETASTQSFAIELTEPEVALLREMEFEALNLLNGEPTRRNGRRARELAQSLLKRKAIPEHRVRWFTDAEYYVGGRAKSRESIFESNGCRGSDILEHPHFLQTLKYWIAGPQLPSPVVDGFCSAVEDCFGHITSSDISGLCKTARQLFRAHRLDRKSAAEEFFKLALECGVPTHHAPMIRDAIMRAR